MRHWAFLLGGMAIVAGAALMMTAGGGSMESEAIAAPAGTSAFDFTLTRIDGKPLPLSAYRGKVILLVNTASMCGFTPQYEGLKALQTRYGPQGFTVIGVPSADFGGQEYSDNGRIKDFCDTTFGINFPLAERASVKGAGAVPLYQWAARELGPQGVPQWNFHKILIGKDGRAIAGFPSRVEPGSPQLAKAIEGAIERTPS
jgi:glutathione peroxidase